MGPGFETSSKKLLFCLNCFFAFMCPLSENKTDKYFSQTGGAVVGDNFQRVDRISEKVNFEK